MELDFRKFVEATTYRPPQEVQHKDYLDYKSRIAAAKTVEGMIFERLAEIGVIVVPGTPTEDKRFGIDGWLVSTDGGKTKLPERHSIQLKIRRKASGNDLLWETIKPWDEAINSTFEELGDSVYTGKDMRCQAKLLLAIDRNGSVVRMRKVAEIIEAAKNMTKEFIYNYRATGRRAVMTPWGQAVVTKDPSTQATARYSGEIEKLNCFILPGSLEWKRDLTLKSPITLV